MWQICNEWTKYHSSLGVVAIRSTSIALMLHAGLKSCKGEVEVAFLMRGDGERRGIGANMKAREA
jgi:hypothetical protein